MQLLASLLVLALAVIGIDAQSSTTSSRAAAPTSGALPFVIVQPFTDSVVAAGSQLLITWTYDSAVLPDSTQVTFNLQDIRNGATVGTVFRSFASTFPISARQATVTVFPDAPQGFFAISTTLQGTYYSSPRFTITAGSGVVSSATTSRATTSAASSSTGSTASTSRSSTASASASLTSSAAGTTAAPTGSIVPGTSTSRSTSTSGASGACANAVAVMVAAAAVVVAGVAF
ncbi:hypothetical protein HDU96_008377 [Phlyctochytrium bullatum]|nr:hypothetical protein HDU96_008377 [Phlyctochytrium bullatum]